MKIFKTASYEKIAQTQDAQCETCKKVQPVRLTGTAQDALLRCPCGGKLLQLQQENWETL